MQTDILESILLCEWIDRQSDRLESSKVVEWAGQAESIIVMTILGEWDKIFYFARRN